MTAKLRIKIVRKGIPTRRSVRGIPTIVAKRLDGSRGRPRPRPHCIIWGSSGDAAPTAAPPHFGPCLLWPNGRPSQQLLSSCLIVHPMHWIDLQTSITVFYRTRVYQVHYTRNRNLHVHEISSLLAAWRGRSVRTYMYPAKRLDRSSCCLACGFVGAQGTVY